MQCRMLKWLAMLLFVAPPIGNAACTFFDKELSFSDGSKACMKDFSFLNIKGLMPKNPSESFAIRGIRESSFAIAVTAQPMLCPFEQNMQWGAPWFDKKEAVASCEKKMVATVAALGKADEAQSCKCEVLIDSGKVPLNRFEFEQKTKLYEKQIAMGGRAIELAEGSSKIKAEQARVAAEAAAKEQQRLANGVQAKKQVRLAIKATATEPDANGDVTISIQTNADTSSLEVNGDEQGGRQDGKYVLKRVARVGQETKFVVTAKDIYGNTETTIIPVFRRMADAKVVYAQLNAANVSLQPARDAVAIIIGIQDYKRVTKAEFASQDAQVFYDYAIRALGIRPNNIKLLVDGDADDLEIRRAFKSWLPQKVKKGRTDVYVFYSGHGLPSEDGKSLYLLPYGVDRDFLERTAINQNDIVTNIQAAQPKSVTMFIDSCFSGQTRAGTTLLGSARPVVIKAKETAYPAEFTVITASANDQISWSSPDLKHGVFSYYLMKAMEGDADANKDGRITAGELQEYLVDMVGRKAMGMNRSQQPQLFGDAERVLVGR